jgi:Ser/Thr protein kinase RdoA (MazF antagonist)
VSEAEQAAALWGGVPGRLLGDRENQVQELLLPGGARAVLRLHRPGYQGDAGILAELEWVAALAVLQFPVAAPIRTLDGALLARLDGGRRASAVAWVEGQPLGRTGEPLPGSPDTQARRYRALGALLARLHRETDAITLPVAFDRPAWDIDGMTGETPVWGRFWDHPAASAADASVLRAARTALRARLERWQADRLSFGPIHADALRENVLVDGDRLSLIDFDDCGTGFRLYDLGVAMVQNLAEPAYPDLRDALIEGYGAGDADTVEWFTLARACASVGWTMPRLVPGDAIHARHIARAVTLARRLLG